MRVCEVQLQQSCSQVERVLGARDVCCFIVNTCLGYSCAISTHLEFSSFPVLENGAREMCSRFGWVKKLRSCRTCLRPSLSPANVFCIVVCAQLSSSLIVYAWLELGCELTACAAACFVFPPVQKVVEWDCCPWSLEASV